METREKENRVICNLEVMEFLKQKRNATSKPRGPLATILYETLRYLEKSHCAHQSRETVTAFLKSIADMPLPITEKLSLVNNPPKTALDIQTLIEFSDDVLTDKDTERLLQLASEHFPDVDENGDSEMVEDN